MEVVNTYKIERSMIPETIFIGRPSVLQNPFPITNDCSREDSIKLFRSYFIKKILGRDNAILSALKNLKETDLIRCYCAPKACHGDTIKEIWEFLNKNGGTPVALDLFDWTYRKEVVEENVMSTPLEQLLSLDCESADQSKEALVKCYTQIIARGIMNRDPAIENPIRVLVNDMRLLTEADIQSDKRWKLDVVSSIVKELHNDNSDYEIAAHHYKKKHSLERIDFNPADDGVTHINVYSKGKTELGRKLSNFAYSPFKHPEHGYFSSVEAFWYWLSLGKDDKLRSLHGFQAKKTGQALRESLEKQGGKPPRVENFKAEIKKAILCKIEQDYELSESLKHSTLPLTHYYVWGQGDAISVTYPEKYAWIHEYISDVRDYLKGKAYKLVIAGSRSLGNSDKLVFEGYENLGIKVIEFVSGMAKRGPDASCVNLAKREKIPLAKFPADWDRLGKSAGFIRNEEMAKYATFAYILWDGVSNGTKDMIERCEKSIDTVISLHKQPKKEGVT